MKHFSYNKIPTPGQFQKDSSVTLAVRSKDRVLSHLDWLLGRYEHYQRPRHFDYDRRRIILCELFLTANVWVKAFHAKKAWVEPQRYPAVLALFEAAVGELGTLLGCTRPMVAQQMEEIFGRDITAEGAKTDLDLQAGTYTLSELAFYRIYFKGGLAYHYGIADFNAPGLGPIRRKLLNSTMFHTALARGDGQGNKAFTRDGWAPFVMTLEREFYMSKHWLHEDGKTNIFHSAYARAGGVACAGTMEVKAGVIAGLRPDSGHYRPLEHNMRNVLLALSMYGVRTDRLALYSWKDEPLGTARNFVRSGLSWDAYQAAGQAHRDQRPGPAVPDVYANSSGPTTYAKSPGDGPRL